MVHDYNKHRQFDIYEFMFGIYMRGLRIHSVTLYYLYTIYDTIKYNEGKIEFDIRQVKM